MLGNPRKDYAGPAIFSFGFRPFFMIASIYAGASVLLWIPLFMGHLEISSTFAPVDWHIHEMLFGFAAAVICGFLLTAVPNWTGRLPVQGFPLLLLSLLWLVGRLAVTYSVQIGWIAATILDCMFLFVLWLVVAREIVRGQNWRNLKVLVPLSVLLSSNLLFHLEASIGGIADYSRRMALVAIIAFILIIGGRIIPSFTRNWLVKFNPGRLPAPFSLFEKINLMASMVTMVGWILLPEQELVGYGFLAASVLLFVQLARWAGGRTFAEPLVLILHISYLFIPVGFLLIGLSILYPDKLLPVVGIHALGTGAVGGMILAVMMRASKGHTGKPLVMKPTDVVLYAAVVIAAISRVICALFPESMTWLITFSGAFWAVGFVGFSIVYGRYLLKPKQIV
nr:NnrS family protein [Sneathiella limimaris]